MTTTMSMAVAEYVGRCFEHLRDLPQPDRDEMLNDIRQIVHEVSAELEGRTEDLLGPPERFVSELRRAAGVSPPEESRAQRHRSHHVVREVWAKLRNRIDIASVVAGTSKLVSELRPAGWVVRGYALAFLVGSLLGAGWDVEWILGVAPVPRSEFLGGLLTAALIVASVLIGRRRPAGWARVAVIAASALAVLASLMALSALRTATEHVVLGDSPPSAIALDESVFPITTMLTSGTVPSETIPSEQMALLWNEAGKVVQIAWLGDVELAWHALTGDDPAQQLTVQFGESVAVVESPSMLIDVLSQWGFRTS